MPLWKIYHPVGAFSLEDKKGLSEAITALYARGLPKFYVGVVFQEVAADSFFIGGECVDNFVRIWIDHIARTMPTAEIRAKFIEMVDAQGIDEAYARMQAGDVKYRFVIDGASMAA